MKIAVISFGRAGSSELIQQLINKNKNVDVIPKPYNHLYPNQLEKKFGRDIKVIFITRNFVDIIDSLFKREKGLGINWIKAHYKNLESDFNDYSKIMEEDTLNFKNLYYSYLNNDIFPTLFIKYENLYFNDKLTLKHLNIFLNMNFISTDFLNNPNNKWTTSKTSLLTYNDKLKITKTFESLQEKINSYNYLYKTSTDYLIKKIVMLKEKNSVGGKRHYRFSDVIHHLGYYWKDSTLFILNNDRFKGTILRSYIERTPNNNLLEINENYLILLNEIIEDKLKNSKINLPRKDELVIHLRLGDVCECDNFIEKNYSEIIQKYIEQYNISKVSFCSAFHYGNNITQGLWLYDIDKQKKNILKCTELFENIINKFKNINIDIKSSENIDEDFIYMVKAKYFEKDIGGFSNMISLLNNNSKRIIQRE